MKRTPWLIFLSCCLLMAKAQIAVPDSARATTAARAFLFSNTDSSIAYAQQALFLARKTDNPRLEGEAYYLLGGNYWITGDYPKALVDILQSLELYEGLHDSKGIADDYRALASIYRDQGDSSKALLYAERCKRIAGDEILVDIYTIFGSIYDKFGNADSARFYLSRADAQDVKRHGRSRYGYISLVRGNIYYKQSNYPLAVSSYRKAIALMEERNLSKDLMEGDIGLARTYRDMSRPDSAILYAQKALQIGRSTPFLLSMLDAGSLLYQLYCSKDIYDSALRYADLTLSIKDSLYNQQKTREFQNLVFKEQIREQEIEQASLHSEAERKENIQMAAIGAFIPVFFMAVLFLSRRRVNSKIIDFMVLIGLLLFFEFITLLVHPRLESWTHHTPVLMLLGLAAIAAILVPSHHRLENWLKKRLAFPHKK